jgi:hypothetical protein
MEICSEVGKSFEAVPVESIKQPGETCDVEWQWFADDSMSVGNSPPSSFSAHIEHLSNCNAGLLAEIENWKMTALRMEEVKGQLEADLSTNKLEIERLNEEARHLRETSDRNSNLAKVYQARALQSDRRLAEMAGHLEVIESRVAETRLEAITTLDKEMIM